jgi:hypothetical protein
MRKSADQTRRLLIITTKAPVAGRAKTRLTTDFSPDSGEKLAFAFLTDLLRTATNPALQATVWIALDCDASALPHEAQGLPIFPQSGNSLGERMVNILEQGLKSGFEAVCLVGSDLPHLPLCFVQEAFGRLEAGAEATIGPTDDGGYYLVGLRTVRRELFENIPWSHPDTFAETMKAAQTAAIQIATLPPWYDIDTAQDLQRLNTDLQRGVALAPETAATRFRYRQSEL